MAIYDQYPLFLQNPVFSLIIEISEGIKKGNVQKITCYNLML